MAKHARSERDVSDKRSALAGAQRNAYVHSDQVGGTRRREADGRWVDRPQEPMRQREQARLRANKPLTIGEFIRRNSAYILSVIAVILIIVLLIAGVRMFSAFSSWGNGDNARSYDWSKLDRSDDRYAYVVDGQVKSRLGIDVAEHEYDIDWDAVAADGIDFAMIRLGYRGATEGDLYIDDCYEANMAGAKAAGLDCGVYFFSQATTEDEAVKEAEFVLSNLGGMPLEYPIAFDFEYVSGVGETRTAGMSHEEVSAVADAFCDRIEQAGYRTLVYGNMYDLEKYDVNALGGRNIWWAEYGVASPSNDIDIVMWQYATDGRIAGIDASVDMNIDLSGVLTGTS